MNRIWQAIFVVFVAATLSGCTSTRAFLTDRALDARDILNVGVESGAIGVSAQAGPLMTGAIYTDAGSKNNGWGLFTRGFGPYNYGDWQLVVAGYKGGESKNERGGNVATLQLCMLANGRGLFDWGTGRPCYYALGNVELRAAMGVGVHAGIHLGELADFLLGWFCVDFMSDDAEIKKIKDTKSNNTPDGIRQPADGSPKPSS